MESPLITSIQLGSIVANALENGCFPVYKEIQTFEQAQMENIAQQIAQNNQNQSSNPEQNEEGDNDDQDENIEVRDEIVPIKIEDDDTMREDITKNGDNWCLDGNGRPIRVDDVIRAKDETMANDNQHQHNEPLTRTIRLKT